MTLPASVHRAPGNRRLPHHPTRTKCKIILHMWGSCARKCLEASVPPTVGYVLEREWLQGAWYLRYAFRASRTRHEDTGGSSTNQGLPPVAWDSGLLEQDPNAITRQPHSENTLSYAVQTSALNGKMPPGSADLGCGRVRWGLGLHPHRPVRDNRALADRPRSSRAALSLGVSRFRDRPSLHNEAWTPACYVRRDTN